MLISKEQMSIFFSSATELPAHRRRQSEKRLHQKSYNTIQPVECIRGRRVTIVRQFRLGQPKASSECNNQDTIACHSRVASTNICWDPMRLLMLMAHVVTIEC